MISKCCSCQLHNYDDSFMGFRSGKCDMEEEWPLSGMVKAVDCCNLLVSSELFLWTWTPLTRRMKHLSQHECTSYMVTRGVYLWSIPSCLSIRGDSCDHLKIRRFTWVKRDTCKICSLYQLIVYLIYGFYSILSDKHISWSWAFFWFSSAHPSIHFTLSQILFEELQGRKFFIRSEGCSSYSFVCIFKRTR
jgi:hypothetical protein